MQELHSCQSGCAVKANRLDTYFVELDFDKYFNKMAEIESWWDSFAAIPDVDWWDSVPNKQMIFNGYTQHMSFKLFSVKKYDRQSNFGHFYNHIITFLINNFINILDPKDHLET